MLHRFITIWNKTNLIKRISIGIGIGVLLAIIFPQAQAIGLLGQIFVGGLKAIAPLLVFALVANALSQQQKGAKKQYEDGHLALSSGNLCGCPGRGSGQLLLSHSYRVGFVLPKGFSARWNRTSPQQSSASAGGQSRQRTHHR